MFADLSTCGYTGRHCNSQDGLDADISELECLKRRVSSLLVHPPSVKA